MNKVDLLIYHSSGVHLSNEHFLTECLTFEEFRKKANLAEYISALLNNSSDSTKSIAILSLIQN